MYELISRQEANNRGLTTYQENARNSKKRTRKGTSMYKGVAYSDGYWYSYVTVNDRVIVGKFKTEIEAATDYNDKVTKLFGEFAKLNQIQEII